MFCKLQIIAQAANCVRISLKQTQNSDRSEAVVLAPLGRWSPFQDTHPARLSCKAFLFAPFPRRRPHKRQAPKLEAVHAHTQSRNAASCCQVSAVRSTFGVAIQTEIPHSLRCWLHRPKLLRTSEHKYTVPPRAEGFPSKNMPVNCG